MVGVIGRARLLSRLLVAFPPSAGLVPSRQIFVRRCHGEHQNGSGGKVLAVDMRKVNLARLRREGVAVTFIERSAIALAVSYCVGQRVALTQRPANPKLLACCCVTKRDATFED